MEPTYDATRANRPGNNAAMSRLSPWRLCQNLSAMVLLLALWAFPGAPAPVAAWQTIPLSGVSASDAPLTLVASAEAVLPAGSTEIVWLVERQPGAAAGETGSALDYVLPRRTLPNMHGEHGASRAVSSAAPVMRLRPGETGTVSVATMDADLTVRFVLVPAGTLPPDAIASEPFVPPGDGRLSLELRQALLAPGQQVVIPANGPPVVLLAAANHVRIEQGPDAPIDLAPGELTLLTTNATIHNPGARIATFVVAGIAPDQAASGDATRGADTEIDAAWQRFGCHLNPGNPACLTVTLAAACAIERSTPGCGADSDADSCLDVSEVRLGFDPFDVADCIASRDGQPALNCLFLAGDLACDGASRQIRGATRPAIDCALRERDPACDGFAPHASS